MLPNRLKISKKASDKLRMLKGHTGLTPNILSRLAIMRAINEGGDLSNAGVEDYDGQEFNQSVLFGDHADVYDVLITQYIHDKNIKLEAGKAIAAMIEVGVHKMGHVRKGQDLVV